jgi:hypothetical protein
MKTFKIGDKVVYFGSNARENSHLVSVFKKQHEDAIWFHLTNRSSSHGFYLSEDSLSNIEINVIGNILLSLSNENGKNNKITICPLKFVKTTKTPGLVNINKERTKRIHKINNFNSNDYLVL